MTAPNAETLRSFQEDCIRLFQDYEDDDLEAVMIVSAKDRGLSIDSTTQHIMTMARSGQRAIPLPASSSPRGEEFGPARAINGHATPPDIGPEPPPAELDHDGVIFSAPIEPTDNPVRKVRFYCVAIDDVQPSLEPAWCVHRLLPARGLAFFVGAPKSGKSFLAADMLFGVARGAIYAGRETLQGPVIYLTGEGVTGFKRRLVALRRHHNVEGQGVPFYMVDNVPDLGSDQTNLTQLLADLDAFLKAAGLPPPRVIALDTLARCMGSGDENTAKDMGRFLARCGVIEQHFGCLVVVIHHFGKDKDRGGRGSNAQQGAADVMIEVEKFEGWNRARVAEMKDGVEGQEWRFRLAPYDLDPEEFSGCCAPLENSTCIVEILSEPAPAQQGATKKKPAALVGVAADLLKVIHRAIDEAGEIGIAGSEAPANARAVSRDNLKRYCTTMDWQQDKQVNSFRAVLSTNLSALRSRDRIGFNSSAVWSTSP